MLRNMQMPIFLTGVISSVMYETALQPNFISHSNFEVVRQKLSQVLIGIPRFKIFSPTGTLELAERNSRGLPIGHALVCVVPVHAHVCRPDNGGEAPGGGGDVEEGVGVRPEGEGGRVGGPEHLAGAILDLGAPGRGGALEADPVVVAVSCIKNFIALTQCLLANYFRLGHQGQGFVAC